MGMRVLRHPLASGTLATAIVIAIGLFAAAKLPTVQPQTETVSAPYTQHIVLKAAAPPAAQGASTNSFSAPQIARTGSASLFVANVDKAVHALSAIGKEQRGDVFALQIDNGDGRGANASAHMELRVPASRFDAAMAALGSVGSIRRSTVSAEDLTGDITDSTARLKNLRRTESDIRKIMDRSGSVSQVMDAENQLSQVREQIETLEAQLKSMRGRIAYASIALDIQAETSAVPVQPTPLAQLASAWHTALAAVAQTSIGIAAALIWLLVFLPYLAVIGALAALVYARRRAYGSR